MSGSDGGGAPLVPAWITAATDLEALRARLAAAPEAERLTEVGLGEVAIGEHALARLPAVLGRIRHGRGEIAMLCDRRPMRLGRDRDLKREVEAMLREVDAVRVVELGGPDADLHADPPTLAAALAGVSGAAALVSVGSGTLSDIGKHTAATLDGLPHVIVQTAASVNGFADDMSVLVIEGVKRTTPSRWADCLIIDTEVISEAPLAMNQAGLGDLLASYTAPADWRLAALMGQDDSFSPTVVALAREQLDAVMERAGGVFFGEYEALEALSAALTLSGVAMGAAGRTAPGSGMEHTVSHLLEMTDHGRGALHGAQVGILSIFSVCLWQIVREEVAGGALTRLQFPAPETMREQIFATFGEIDESGAMAAECWRDYERKLARHNSARAALAGLDRRWPAFETEVDALLTGAEKLAHALRLSGAPKRLAEIGIAPERARWALQNCHLMRDRFTIADLAFLLGLWDAEGVQRVIARAERLGVGL